MSALMTYHFTCRLVNTNGVFFCAFFFYLQCHLPSMHSLTEDQADFPHNKTLLRRLHSLHLEPGSSRLFPADIFLSKEKAQRSQK